jgi:hypothetical protein
MNEKNDSGVAIDSTPLLAMLSDEERRFRGMQKIMEHDGQTDTAIQMRYIAAGIEHARIKVETMIANNMLSVSGERKDTND